MIHIVALAVSLVLVADAVVRERKPKLDIGMPARTALGIVLCGCGYLSYGIVVVVMQLGADAQSDAKGIRWVEMLLDLAKLVGSIAAGMAAGLAAQRSVHFLLHLVTR